MKLTVFFDGQLWVGIVKQQDDDGLKVARHLFGSEPIDTEVYAFVQRAIPSIFNDILVTSASDDPPAVPPKTNPKRLKREAAAEARGHGTSTYAQELLKRDLEARKHDRQNVTRQQQEDECVYKRSRKLQKAKEKHRGH